MIHEQSLSTEEGISQSLGLVLLAHTASTREKRILSQHPPFAVYSYGNHISEQSWCERHLAGTTVGRLCHVSASEHLGETQLDFSLSVTVGDI